MNLLDLPRELFSLLILTYVNFDGIHEAWRKRGVSKAFAFYIEREVLENQPLEVFYIPRTRGPPKLSRLLSSRFDDEVKCPHGGMPNFARFLLAKTKQSSRSRPVFRVIRNCLDFLLRDLPEPDEEKWMLTAKELCTRLVYCNDRRLFRLDEIRNLPIQDILVAAVLMSNHEAISACIRKGATPWGLSGYFGSPLLVTPFNDPGHATLKFLLQNISPCDITGTGGPSDFSGPLRGALDTLHRDERPGELFTILEWYIQNHPNLSNSRYNYLLRVASLKSNDLRPANCVLACSSMTPRKVAFRTFQAINLADNAHILSHVLKDGSFDGNRRYGRTSPLHDAAYDLRVECVRELLIHGADPDGPYNVEGHNPLKRAIPGAAMGPEKLAIVINLLKSHGATWSGHDLEMPDSIGHIVEQAKRRRLISIDDYNWLMLMKETEETARARRLEAKEFADEYHISLLFKI